MNVRDKSKRRKLVSVVGSNYPQMIVPDLFVRAFEGSLKRDYASKNFQVSAFENSYATSAVVLTVLAIEAYRNRAFYLSKRSISRQPAKDLSDLLGSKLSGFKTADFQALLTEAFILRDVIVHNHLYEVTVDNDDDWNMVSHRQRLLEGYGDSKFTANVTSRTRKTKLLKLNVQPLKIGFPELFKLLIVLDVLITLINKTFGSLYAPFHLHHKAGEVFCENLSEFLAHYYQSTQDPSLKKEAQALIQRMRRDFRQFTADRIIVDGKEYSTYSDRCVLNNCCPKCGAFGFEKPGNTNACKECGFALRFEVNDKSLGS